MKLNLNKLILTFSIFTIGCTKTPDFSLDHTNKEFKIIERKIETNEELEDKDFNLIFKTVTSEKIMNKIDSMIVAESIVFSKQKNLVRAYMESFLAFKDKKKYIQGLKRIYNDNPMLVKRYLEYFTNDEQKVLKTALAI